MDGEEINLIRSKISLSFKKVWNAKEVTASYEPEAKKKKKRFLYFMFEMYQLVSNFLFITDTIY